MPNPKSSLLIIRLLRPFFHVLIILWLFWWAILLRRSTDLIPGVQLRIPVVDTTETMLFALTAVVLFFVIGLSKEIYELQKPLHSYYKKFLETRFWWIMLLFAIAYLWFWYVFVSGISRFILVRSGVGFLLIATLFDRVRNTLNTQAEKNHPYTIHLTGNDTNLLDDVRNNFLLYEIYQLIDTQDADILLVVGNHTRQQLQKLADQARISWQSFYHISSQMDLEDLISTPARVWPVMAMEYKPSPLEWRWKVIKRIFDLIVSGWALLLLSPLMLIIALGIKLDSTWPILYRHTRVGKNSQHFLFSKFRTMYTHLSVGEEYGWAEALQLKKDLMASDANVRKWPLQKIEHDPRVTRFGRFLRKTSLDELPNLFNVFVGNMSLVGPRPHEPFEVARYEDRQKRLLALKPGMTGYAQLFGRDQLPFAEEAKLDLYYTQNRSIFLDLYVLVGTIKVVFKGR